MAESEKDKAVRLHLARNSSLRNEFNRKKAIYIDIRNYVAPHTARFEGEKFNDGQRQDTNIINSHVRFAPRTLAAGMQSGITSPARPWFRLGTPDPDLQKFQPVKVWLNDVERLMRETILRSNFYDRVKSNYGILGNYGTSMFFVDEDPQDTIRCYDLLFGSFFIGTNAAGRVDSMHRDTSLTAHQLVQRKEVRGWLIPDNAQLAYDNGNTEQRFEVLHVVEPNRNYKPNSDLPHHKLFVSLWIDKSKGSSEGAIMSISGFDDLAFMGSRWDVVGEDDYGIGCGELALGDCKGIQLLEKRDYQILDKIANPPMVADASLRNHRVSQLPGDTSYVTGLINGKPGYAPAYQITNAPLNAVEAKIERLENRIDEAYFKNLFLMVAEIGDRPDITATQINAMREEKLLMLGPVLERLNDELLDPFIDRTFNIMLRSGMLPPPPPELSGMPLKVEYISVLAQAQRAIGLGNIERFVGFVGNMGQVSPSALDKLNMDEIIDQYAEGSSVPPQIVRSTEEVEAERQERAKQQQQMQQLAAAQPAADIAKTVSDIDLSGDNPVTRALAAQQQQAPVDVSG